MIATIILNDPMKVMEALEKEYVDIFGILEDDPVNRVALLAGHVGHAIPWLRQHCEAVPPDQIVEATLHLQVHPTSRQHCVTLSTTVLAAIGAHITSLVISGDTIHRLLDSEEGTLLLQVICPRLQQLFIIRSQPSYLQKITTVLSKCKCLQTLSIETNSASLFGLTEQLFEQQVHNFANALESFKSLETILLNKGFGQESPVTYDTNLLTPVLEALGTLPELSTLQLDAWIPPKIEPPTEIDTKFLQLLDRITNFQIHYKKLPAAYKAIQSSKNIRSLTVQGFEGDQETYRLIRDLVCPPNNQNPTKAIQLEKLTLHAKFPTEENEGLTLIDLLASSSKIKDLNLHFYYEEDDLRPNVNLNDHVHCQQKLETMLGKNLCLSCVQIQKRETLFYNPEDVIGRDFLDLCMERNQRYKALVEDPQATVQHLSAFLMDFQKEVNTIFCFLSTKPYFVGSLLAGGDGVVVVEDQVAVKDAQVAATTKAVEEPHRNSGDAGAQAQLAAALKRIEELEAKNASLLAQNASLKAQFAEQKTGAI